MANWSTARVTVDVTGGGHGWMSWGIRRVRLPRSWMGLLEVGFWCFRALVLKPAGSPVKPTYRPIVDQLKPPVQEDA